MGSASQTIVVTGWNYWIENKVLDKYFEVVEDGTGILSTGQTDEGFEVVEEDKIDEVSNVLHGANDDILEAFPDTKNISPEVEMVSSVKDSSIEPQKAATPEPEIVDNSVINEKQNIMTEVETIGSIQDSDVEIVGETISEPIVVAPQSNVDASPEPTESPSFTEPPKDSTPEPASAPEPIKVCTPEPVETPTPEPPKASSPEPILTPEPIASTNEPEKAPAAEPLKDSTPEPIETLTSEPIKVTTPEPDNAVTAEALKAPSSVMNEDELASQILSGPVFVKMDVSSDMEVIGAIEENKEKNVEEDTSAGAAGLRDVLQGSKDSNEE